uniref:Uncharacterized protein n=1 Tax=Myotis myotis TaxID=51298 RepID=A0A7J7T5P2_MYOMY|nr:hypothetical protein mMyoMyo1_009140 [Myotis myotis]
MPLALDAEHPASLHPMLPRADLLGPLRLCVPASGSQSGTGVTDEGDPGPVALVLNTREAMAFTGVGRCFTEWRVPRTQESDGCLRARWMDCLGAASGLLGCWWEKLRVCGPEFAGASQTRGQEC